MIGSMTWKRTSWFVKNLFGGLRRGGINNLERDLHVSNDKEEFIKAIQSLGKNDLDLKILDEDQHNLQQEIKFCFIVYMLGVMCTIMLLLKLRGCRIVTTNLGQFIVFMDSFEKSMNVESGRFDLQTLSQSTSQSYNAFIRQQQNRRQTDRRYRNETVSIDYRKRINNRMLSTNNTSKVDYVHEYIIHSEASTSNEEMINIFYSKLHGSSNLLSVQATAYVLPTCAYCKHCGARKLYRETKSFCCFDGNVKLFMPDSPDELYTLFTSKKPVSMEFKKYARSYNNYFAFTSFGVTYDKELIKTYKVSTHLEFRDKKPYENFRTPGRIYFISSNRNIEGLDQRVFNTPSASQVAAIWVEDDENANICVRDITIYGHSGYSHRVHYYYGCYAPLQYPLPFSFGECGWHEGILRYEQISSQIAQFVDNVADPNVKNSAAQIIEKEAAGSLIYFLVSIIVLQILFQQYVVDMYVKIETSILDYFRSNQKQIRAELYQGIVDSIHNGETRGYKIGKKVVLPRSFTCGPRDMLRRYLDVMALVQQIKQELKHNDKVQNRPDLIVRVFRAKLEELKNDLYKRNIFGSIIAHIYVIEFQKRGLPHAHLLLIFNCAHKISSTKQVDKIVSCEISDKNIRPYLLSIIVKHNMHGPYGNLNPKNTCMEKNSCCKNKYPKDYCNSTIFGDNLYSLYRRRNNGIYVKVRGKMLDNQWVVPYNPYLSTKFDCHINVEVCSSIKTVKYLYKYVYKEHDLINFLVDKNNIDKDIDEISTYQSVRWIFPPEAMWRIFAFNLSKIYLAICDLQLHIEDHQCVTYKNTDNLSSVIENENTRKTMLTEHSFSEKKQIVVGRIVSVNLSEGERYFLRLLLNHIRGPTSFDDLKTFNGVNVGIFREAALLYGLLNGDTRCEECLSETIIYEMSYSLRRLFATLLTMCNPNNHKLLWDKFKPYKIDDYINQNMPAEIVEV
ncbi:uncharacterized protein LOC111366630 [Olea europaea var. sylvestris]|uniref:uncharacterized protein LOC111366630 n=1 Tax=Olea europaea var. sylvestris TaxID=158386 RepID=UPI000C1D6653|nr:uncharacterized protein LOC111366630 [Olea europaea var. sylvestris]